MLLELVFMLWQVVVCRISKISVYMRQFRKPLTWLW